MLQVIWSKPEFNVEIPNLLSNTNTKLFTKYLLFRDSQAILKKVPPTHV